MQAERWDRWAIVLAAAGVLAACGSNEGMGSSGAPVDDVLGVRPGQTYDEAANLVACTHDLMVVQADNSRGFQIQTYGQQLRQGFSARFAEPRVVKDSRDHLREMSEEAAARSGNAVREDMQPGQSKWYVGTMGLPGQERVISAALRSSSPGPTTLSGAASAPRIRTAASISRRTAA